MAARKRLRWVFLLAVAALACAACTSKAATVRVGSGERCITAGVNAAQPGDTVLVAPAVYYEHGIVIDKAITLIGLEQPIIDAGDQGEIITVTHDGVIISGFTLRNVGTSFIEDRAAIRLKGVTGAQVTDNRIEKAFFGIYAEHSTGVQILRNRLVGTFGREVSTGNGIHLWYCKEVDIEDNEIRGHRDGIYFEFVEDSRIARNVSTHNIRYGLHFMFSHHDTYIDNVFADNGAGVAVMYTQYVTMVGNTFDHNWGTSSYGLLLKDIRDSEIRHNKFYRNTIGLYAEGSNRITVEENEFTSNGYAVRIMANSMSNTFRRNNFVGNGFDVVTNSRQSFNTFDSNYWSEYGGYDLDGDGVGDVPHHPVRLFSLLVEKARPSVILLSSLFVVLVDTAERVMPVFTPETLADQHPLVSMVALESAPQGGTR